MSSQSEIDKLAEFIVASVPGEPSESEGAGTTAIRVIKSLQAELVEARAVIEQVRAYAKEREAYGRQQRIVSSARIASDLLHILGDD